MRKRLRKLGFISIEVVITAALFLSVGFFGLMTFGTTGVETMDKAMGKLDILGVFGNDKIKYDNNGYDKTLNIDNDEINSVEDFEFIWDEELNGWVTVKYLNTSDLSVVIPNKNSDGKPIVKIGSVEATGIGTFSSLGIISVAIPNSVKVLGFASFNDNPLTEIIIPDSVTIIDEHAFGYCNLETVIIPASVVTIGYNAFMRNELNSVEFKGSVPDVIGDLIFEGNGRLGGRTILVTQANLSDYKAHWVDFGLDERAFYAPTPPFNPKDINSESDFTFVWNETLNGWSISDYLDEEDIDVVIPSKRADGLPVVEIGAEAFAYKPIIIVIIPNSIINIMNDAFYGTLLTSVSVPNSVKYIGEDAFSYSALQTVFLSEGLISIGDSAFYNGFFKTIDIPNTVTNIGACAFYSNQLEYVNLGNGIKTIGDVAFSENEIKTLIVPNSVTSIGVSAFANNELTSVTLSNHLISIGNEAFKGNYITSIVIPDSVKTIGVSAFKGNLLASLILPITVESIGQQAFNDNFLPESQAYIFSSGSDSFELISYGGHASSLNIPTTTLIIGSSVFENAIYTSLYIPDGVTTIGARAFESIQAEVLIIPNSVSYIGINAFSHSKGLRSVTFEGNMPTVETKESYTEIFAFYNWGWDKIMGPASVRVPASELSIYRSNAYKFGIPSNFFFGY